MPAKNIAADNCTDNMYISTKESNMYIGTKRYAADNCTDHVPKNPICAYANYKLQQTIVVTICIYR